MVTVTQQTLLGVLKHSLVSWVMLENEDKPVKAVPFFFVNFVQERNKFVVFYQRSAVPFVMPWFSDLVWPSHPCLYYLFYTCTYQSSNNHHIPVCYFTMWAVCKLLLSCWCRLCWTHLWMLWCRGANRPWMVTFFPLANFFFLFSSLCHSNFVLVNHNVTFRDCLNMVWSQLCV